MAATPQNSPETIIIDFSECVVCREPIHTSAQSSFHCCECERYSHHTCQSYQLIKTGNPTCYHCKSLSRADAFFWNNMVKVEREGPVHSWTLITHCPKIPTLTEELSHDEN